MNAFSESAGPLPRFDTTHWSLVLAAFHADGAQGEAAMAKLAEVYWLPIYSFLRRKGQTVEEAEDLTQELFLRLLDKRHMSDLEASGGKFRCYLVTVLMHLLADRREREGALKRIPRKKIISVDAAEAEARYQFEPMDNATPQDFLERRWAMALLDRVRADLREMFVQERKAELFDALVPCLTGSERLLAYAELGTELGLSEGALRVAVHRLRKRFGELLRAAIAETVCSGEDLEAEIEYFIELTSR